jgi:hypothetical protein
MALTIAPFDFYSYGFVTFPSEDDATKAVSQLDKSEISGRQINVELAKPMPANGSAAARAPKRAAKKAAETAVTEETAKEGVEGEEEGQPKKRKARKAVSLLCIHIAKFLEAHRYCSSSDSASPVDLALPAPMARLKKLAMPLNNPPRTPFTMLPINSPLSPSKMVPPLLPAPASPVLASPSAPSRPTLMLPPSMESLLPKQPRVMALLPLPANASLALPVVVVLPQENPQRPSVCLIALFSSSHDQC